MSPAIPGLIAGDKVTSINDTSNYDHTLSNSAMMSGPIARYFLELLSPINLQCTFGWDRLMELYHVMLQSCHRVLQTFVCG